jgi:threonine/homoserine/homoserine lactone efflux protein
MKRRGNRGAGAGLLAVAIAAFIIYAYLMFGTQYDAVVMKFTMVGAVGVLLLVLGWIGYTMLTAPKEEPGAATPNTATS